LSSLETDNDKTGKQLLQTRQHVAILEDYIENLQVRQEPVKAPSNSKQQSLPEIIDRITMEEYDENSLVSKSSKVVKVEDFIAKEADTEMSIDFKLVNTLPEEIAMEGYIHIIPTDEEGNLFSEWNYTTGMLKDGYPQNFRRGQPFLIQRFKPYHRIFTYNPNSELPSAIRILVYDKEGKKILENEYKVDDVS
jgi:hypothetical protein